MGQEEKERNLSEDPIEDFTCEVCSKKLSSKQNLDRHLIIHTGLKPFKCPEPNCGYSCSDKGSLKIHEVMHTAIKSHQCSLCPYKTVWSQALRRHIKTIHSIERPFPCDHCGYRAKLKSLLTDHMKRHLDPEWKSRNSGSSSKNTATTSSSPTENVPKVVTLPASCIINKEPSDFLKSQTPGQEVWTEFEVNQNIFKTSSDSLYETSFNTN